MTIDEIFPSNLRALEERVKRQRERVSELQRSGQDATNAKIVLDVMTESLVRLLEFHEKNCVGRGAVPAGTDEQEAPLTAAE
jgi:hypothetical protein